MPAETITISPVDMISGHLPESAVHTKSALQEFKSQYGHGRFVWPSLFDDQLFMQAQWLSYPWHEPHDKTPFIKALAEATKKDGRQLILDLGTGKSRTPFEAAQRFDNTTILAVDAEVRAPETIPVPEKGINSKNNSLIISFLQNFSTMEGINADRIHWMSPEEMGSLFHTHRIDRLLAPGGYLVTVFVRSYSEYNYFLEDFNENLPGYNLVQEEMTREQIHERFGFSHTNYDRSRDGVVSVIHGSKPIDSFC